LSRFVSILIPAYRSEGFVAETIQSALDQTWPHKEIIVVDDGSPDRTYEIAKQFESSVVKVVTQENSGAPSARNKAYSLAQGDYIQWLDADDLLHPDKIKTQLADADSGLTSRTLLTCRWGRFFFRPEKAEFVPDSLWRDHSPLDWIVTRFSDNVWMNPAVWLVSRKLTELAGPWDPRLARSGDDDGEYICRVAGAADAVRFVPEACCYYRIGIAGSLNWNMETSKESLESLMLSLTTTVRYVLSLEDSTRTRDAAAIHLQTFMPYFYGADDRFYYELNAFAQEFLGCELYPPGVSWKYRPLELVAGPHATRRILTYWRSAKLLMRGRYDAFRLRQVQQADSKAQRANT